MKNTLLIIILGLAAIAASAVAHAQNTDNLLPPDNIFDTLSVDLKVNGSDGPVNVAVGERITISWESDGAKRCKGNWSKKDLSLDGKITGKLNSSYTSSITIRIACIDADGNRDDDSVTLKITGASPIPVKNPVTLPPPPPTDQPIIISSCGEITKGGGYVVDRDLSATEGACINVHDISDVHINCSQHSVIGNPAIELKNISGMRIENCKFDTTENGFILMKGVNDKEVTISRNVFGTKVLSPGRTRVAPVNIDKGSNINFSKNDIYTTLDLYNLNDTSIVDNTFVLAHVLSSEESPFVAANININDGHGNKIVGNTIDGGSDGIYRSISTAKGADDGIAWDDQTDLTIEQNTISNVWDCGVEGSGDLIRGRVISNSITNAGLCGIGSWYDSSIESSIFTDNTVTDAPRIFQFHFVKGIKNQTVVVFRDNIFRNNKIVNPRINKQSGKYDTDQFNFTAITGLIAVNNTFIGNDFSKMRNAPYMNPGTLAVDGGTNICKELGANFSNINYPLACGR